jgi:large subunit ribosomal protein L4
MKTKVYSTDGAEVKEMELEDSVFQAKVSDGAIYYAVINELANRRVGTASTKTRGETNGSNAKPWPQKGTGRARSGDRKSPVWVGGGTVFGPKPRDYSYRIPKKMKRAAYRSILTMKAKNAELKIVEDFTVGSGKTKDLAAILGNFGDDMRTVVVLGHDDTSVRRAGRNIPWLRIQSFNRLSAHDLFYGRRLIMLESAATNLGEMYGRTV